MAPAWREVHHLSGMPLDELVWLVDPPASSYPASVADKAAELQGAAAGEAYLRRAREAVMLERRNIARPAALLPRPPGRRSTRRSRPAPSSSGERSTRRFWRRPADRKPSRSVASTRIGGAAQTLLSPRCS